MTARPERTSSGSPIVLGNSFSGLRIVKPRHWPIRKRKRNSYDALSSGLASDRVVSRWAARTADLTQDGFRPSTDSIVFSNFDTFFRGDSSPALHSPQLAHNYDRSLSRNENPQSRSESIPTAAGRNGQFANTDAIRDASAPLPPVMVRAVAPLSVKTGRRAANAQ